MSEGTPPLAPREWRFYLDDMIEFSEKVLTYTDGFDQSRFEQTGLNYDATLRNWSWSASRSRTSRSTRANLPLILTGDSSSPPAIG